MARSLAERDRTLKSMAITLGGSGVLTILIAFGAGWALSVMSLRPIDRITKTAQAIGDERDFVADVSHELRTPLTTLRGNLGLLRREPPAPPEEQAKIGLTLPGLGWDCPSRKHWLKVWGVPSQ